MKKNFFDLNSSGKIFLWVVALPQILGLLAEMLLMFVCFIFGLSINEVLGISYVSIAFAMLTQVAILIILLALRKSFDLKQALKFQSKIGTQNSLVCILIGIVGVASLSPIVGWFSAFLQSVGYVSSSLNLELASPALLVIAILLFAFVPAVLEELVFRGCVLQGLKGFGKWAAILGTSALFVLVHGSLEQIIYPFILSIFLCSVVLRTNSVVCAIIVHFVSNTASLILSYFEIAFILPVWAMLLVAVAGILVMWLLTKLLKNTEKPRPNQEVWQAISGPVPEINNNPHSLKVGIFLAVLIFVFSVVTGFMPQV